MTTPHEKLDAVKLALSDLSLSQDPTQLDIKSRDYYWYSPVLKALLDPCRGELIVRVRTEGEVMRVAAACATQRVNITVRGGGTGNYGQCVPLEGGVILDITGLNRVLDIQAGSVRVQAGALVLDLERAVRASSVVAGGQELLMFPSTRDTATIGGFIRSGYGGAGSVRNGILKDPGNVTCIRIVTLEETPRIIELRDADIQKVHHAFGTNGIMTELTLALKPAVEWVHHIALFSSYRMALEFGVAATEAVARANPIKGSIAAAPGPGPVLDAFEITAVDQRFAPFYADSFGPRFPSNRDAVFSMVHPASLEGWRTLMRAHGGEETMAMTEDELTLAKLVPAFECAWNHTTLMALRHDKSWTNLQTVYRWPLDIDLLERQMARYGDEVLMHHEFGRDSTGFVVFGLPLVAFIDKERIYEIIREHEADGCLVFDNHVYTIEGGGMKTIDDAQINLKKVADPHGLMNPGKTEGWKAEYVQA
ncbi:MAG: FAD-binding oxidoreductase [Rhodoferax sp.]|nr:FAD-binding oxidoreductase [Rhodoferax sp.]